MARKAELVSLLMAARRFDNETVQDAGQMAAWRIKVDQALEGEVGDDPIDRWDYPPRVKHRKLVQDVLRGNRK